MNQPGGAPAANPAAANPDEEQPSPNASAAPPTIAAQQPGAQPPAAMPQGMQPPAMTQPPGTQPGAPAQAMQMPTAPGAAALGPGNAGTATVRLDPPIINQAAGTTAAVNVMLDSAAPVHDFSLELKYDANAMQLINVANGGYLSRDGQPATVVHRAEGGDVRASAIRAPGAPGVPGQGAVLTLVFLLNKPGDYSLIPVSAVSKNANGLMQVNLAGQTAVKIVSAPHR